MLKKKLVKYILNNVNKTYSSEKIFKKNDGYILIEHTHHQVLQFHHEDLTHIFPY